MVHLILMADGKYDTVDEKFENEILKTVTFQVRGLDLQALGGAGDGTGKNFGHASITRLCLNRIHQRVWKK